ncbi:MAG: ribose-phosphate pyrophosphokinase-like domain-containing protein, partial [Eubacteriales bacterium]|nr:ribose-phosphate pyrophosphokinase-like domain-containing protein [Eubacteriales bacterium]
MNLHGKDIRIFAGSSNKELAGEIAQKIGLPLGAATVGKFSDGETMVNIGEP